MRSLLSGQVVELVKRPTAVAAVSPEFGVIGSVVRLDGQQSTDPLGRPLKYEWSFIKIPIASKVRAEGFRSLVEDGSVVSFSPDVVGEYLVGLTVTNGSSTSKLASVQSSIQAILVPHGRGIVPDGKFIWSYIRDVWTQVEDREWFETFWSALIQITGSELLKTYQADFNKTIRDAQDTYQRRWMSYSPTLKLEGGFSFYLGNQCAGMDATTDGVGRSGQAILVSDGEAVVVTGSVLPDVSGEVFSVGYDVSQPINTGKSSAVSGMNRTKTGYILKDSPFDSAPGHIYSNVRASFQFGSTTWSLSSSSLLAVGDVVRISSGQNSGTYRVIGVSGTSVTVDRTPPSQASGVLVDVYRPVGFTVTQREAAVTDTVAMAYSAGENDVSKISEGRIIVVNGQPCTVLRTSVVYHGELPLSIVTLDRDVLLSRLRSQSWRAPNTLVSDAMDFESLGVSTGDVLVVDVIDQGSMASTPVNLQVVGVDRNRLGFVFTEEPTQAGVVPEVSQSVKDQLSSGLGEINFPSATSYVGTRAFRERYLNQKLTQDTEFYFVSRTFKVIPRSVIRNSKIPVDDTVVSVPMLQDWITQPTTISKDGKHYQVKDGKEYSIPSLPVSLMENTDYVIDNEMAYSGPMTFRTGSDIVEADDGHFFERGIRVGDTFRIMDPVTLAGDYRVLSVLSSSQVRLSRPVPRYVLGEDVTATVQVVRSSPGHFLRFVPQSFTAKSPAPGRLWAEVTFFDNSDAIEKNFGVLVGLTKEKLDKISSSVNYRQAVAGMMYAFTKGSAIDKIRIGAQILLGLPFAEHRGIIRDIQSNYRLGTDGSPSQGRLLIEDIDESGNPLGTRRIYTFPIIEDGGGVGLEVNPSTGSTYAVGDTVELFSPLSTGVEVNDYLTSPLDPSASGFARLRQYHTLRMRAEESVFSTYELGLVSDFLRKITPSYVAFVVSSSFSSSDHLETCELAKGSLSAGPNIVDTAGWGFPSPLILDGKSLGKSVARWDDGYYWVRATGTMNTEPGSDSGTTSGGLVIPGNGEGPVTRVGDVLAIHDGLNRGIYKIYDVSDTRVAVEDPPPFSDVSKGFQGENQHFSVLRPIGPVLRKGTGSFPENSVVVSVEPGLTADGVSEGDWIVTQRSSYLRAFRRTVLRVGPAPESGGYPELLPGQILVDKAFPDSATGTNSYSIYRPTLIPDGFQPGDDPAPISTSDISGPSNKAVFSYHDHTQALLEVGDELRGVNPPHTRYLVLDAENLYVTPPVYMDSVLLHKHRPTTPVGTGNRGLVITPDVVEVDLVESSQNSVTYDADPRRVYTNNVTPADILARPGDFLVLTHGDNSLVDVGYGPGVYPIADTRNDYFTLTVPLSSSSQSGWKLKRRR